MTLKSKLKIESLGVLVFSIFYVVVGATEVFVVVTSNFTAPPHIGVLGLLNLFTAYGLFKMKRWSVLLVIALFFLGITFGATTLYNSVVLQTFEGTLLFRAALIVYMIMLLIASVYVVAKREKLE
jgi:hypothetical protein